MRTVYATQFRVEINPQDSWEKLLAIVASWIGRYYKNKKIIIASPLLNGTTTPIAEHCISVESVDLPEAKQFWQLDWAHPDDYDASLLWDTQVTLALSDDKIEFGIVVKVSSKSFTVMPARFALGRPWLVKKISTDFQCNISSQTIKPDPIRIGATDIDNFVESLMTNRARALPIALVSVDPYSEKAIIEPSKLADTLVGLAEVYVLADKWAAFRLTDVVGKSLSCFNGAIRIYWPDFTLDSKPSQHPLWLANTVEWHEENGRPFHDYLLRMLAAIASFRHSDGSLTRRVRNEVDAQRQRHIDNLRSEIKAGNYNLKEAESYLEEIANENDTLTRERDKARERLSELEGQLKTAQANLAAVYQYESETQEQEIVEQPHSEDPTFSSVSDAVDRAKKRFSDSLLFLESSFDSAKNSPFKRPERVYQALEAINDVCLEWREAQKKGESMGRTWVDAFSQKGFDYKDGISMTSKGKYEDDYYFIYEGQRLLFESHITEGAKQPDKCFSIHLHRDADMGKVVIGHIGRHLTNTNT